ncbi:hypothetical protein KQ302_02455 [Synechococcus sp. CS-602]|uniref:hypothetical protein n=1 Tax=Synechococcaceae TaxID=1890426 RepID=UPI0008FF3707|nr:MULTISPECIES: hypothetical protein [Synechococcaceae]MCT4364827.1 hypothetical protein [Candidatus Regnicoccus frigidus MAG-AL1]APD48114.1 hypothetical protein BM449_07455 [Synechococcus sp. SynAce01]MCT0203331.1 hypothetical protein [Synechococcus sp. CS-603]MCT0203979.1 hypothetical protein [Synechococcus sp. CS-602]MCT0246551.1 hypothetical protein [Synechococcus sp. CS-601]
MAPSFPACPLPRPLSAEQHKSGSPRQPASVFIEGGHQLEKLEFSLAVAMAKGEFSRADQLRSMIADLGGEGEEPGT